MNKVIALGWFLGLVLGTPVQAQTEKRSPIIIAHRGASGYLPEHTEGAKVLALSQGADYIEQDVVLSKDGVFVVSHDITMEETTDVEDRFPDRHRQDGRYYFVDFTWDEIQKLTVHERTQRKTGQQAFASRFPGGFGQHLMRLEHEVALIRGWNKVQHTEVGIYVELKSPAFHRQNLGYSMGEKLLPLLKQLGYSTKEDACFVQCFEADELRSLKSSGCELKLIQLTGGNRPASSPDGWDAYLSQIAKYADGIGPSLDWIVDVDPARGLNSSGLVESAHAMNLQVHPYTIRKDALPKWIFNIDELHRLLTTNLQVDGFFTDFPDVSREAIGRMGQ